MPVYPVGGMVPHHPQNSEFYSHPQAKILAETYYNLGKNLYDEVLPLLQLPICRAENSWRIWPAFVNLSFSCEIILKLFYENDNGQIAHGHKLKRDLFDKLSADSKKLISDLTISCMKVNGFENYVYTDFCEDLIKSEDTFVNERYVFEVVDRTIDINHFRKDLEKFTSKKISFNLVIVFLHFVLFSLKLKVGRETSSPFSKETILSLNKSIFKASRDSKS